MKLLIITQALDSEDPVLGFFHAWVAEFARHCEQVTVICLREGVHDLPHNVRVYSLGKEKGARSTFAYALRFLRLAIAGRSDYDAVFVHMNPEYVLLGGFVWRLWGKRVCLWYTHKRVSATLRGAALLADVICTASAESFRIASPKLRVMGHGVGPAFFQLHLPSKDLLRILTVGRISPTKKIKEMLAAIEVLYARGKVFTFTVIGAPATGADERYAAELEEELRGVPYRPFVRLSGPVSHRVLPGLIAESDIFLNLSATGSLDKAVLEAMAGGLSAASSNEAFREVLEPLGLFIEKENPEAIADTIERAAKADTGPLVAFAKEHSLGRLIANILTELRP